MKILYVTSSAYPFHSSGVATVVKNISRELKNKGHEIYVFTLATNKEYKDKLVLDKKTDEYEIRAIVLHNTIDDILYSFTEASYNNKEIEPDFIRYLQEVNPDIVHFHAIQGLGVNLIKLAKLKGYATIVTIHDWWWLCPNYFMADIQYKQCMQKHIDINKCYECISKDIIKIKKKTSKWDTNIDLFLQKRSTILKEALEIYTDQVLCVSEYILQYFCIYNQFNTNISINKNGVEEPKVLKEYTTNTEKTIVFGFLGGTSELKGYKIVKDAFDSIKNSQCELRIYGVSSKSPKSIKKLYNYLKEKNIQQIWNKIKSYRKILKEQKQSTNIKYFPYFSQDEKNRIFSEIDILIANTIVKESSSLVVREALSRNIPVIISKSGGPEEVVKHNVNGIILKDNTEKQLRDTVENIIESQVYIKWRAYMENNIYNYFYSDQVKELEIIYFNTLK
nr:glycosyltransferase [uncultured Niameybacter sp.]